ncbi:MAG: DoxX family protein, partial [Syntrophothermus sp.]
MKYFKTIARILVGLVFVASSLMKGIDPLGTAYRITDYFLAFGMPWATQFSGFLSIFLCTLEFIIGICLLLNILMRQISWVLLLMMIYFTVLTFFDARYNLVPDCGCFGDIIKITNLQTFLKNVVLMALVIPVFIYRKQYRSWAPMRAQLGFFIMFIAIFAGMSVHAMYHLPVIDTLPWKVGNTINKQDLKPVKFYVT